MPTNKLTYYIASAKCYQVKSVSGEVMTKDGDTAWLAMDEGYPACTKNKKSAKRFDEPPALHELARWDGMPWWYRFKPDTIKIFKVDHTITHEDQINEQIITTSS